MKHKVFVSFPKSGLGNLLLIWSRAKMFSQLNGLPMITSGWWGFRWGTWWRQEKRKRLYWNYFHESPLALRMLLFATRLFYKRVKEPLVRKMDLPAKPTIFWFSNPAIQQDLFAHIRNHRDFIRTEIHKLLKPELSKQLETVEKPVIAVHIRRGDFKYGNPITPLGFFIDSISFIRAKTGNQLPVTVFTDAAQEEIREVLSLNGVKLAERKADILDLLQMSKSRFIVLSQSSTFSYWAAFLSDAIVVRPVGDWQLSLRPANANGKMFEGMVSFQDPDSLNKLSAAIEKEIW